MQSTFMHQCLLISFIALGIVAAGCSMPPAEDNTMDGDVQDVSYAADILPIFQARCAGCHAEDGSSGITLLLTEAASYERIVDQPSVQDEALTLIVPGDADSSLLYLKVSSDDPPVGNRMPLLGDALTAAELALLQQWIEDGAANN